MHVAAAWALTAGLFTLTPGHARAARVATEGVEQATVRATGTVVDEKGEPVIGANVVVKGQASKGTITDVDGRYTLSVESGATLLVSYIGYKTEAVAAGQGATVRLTPDSKSLDEVIVVGYGTQKKKDLTGSVSQLDSKLLEVQSATTVTSLLEGAVAGLQISSVDGQPGLDMAIRLRGLGSASSNNSNALIIIDGVPNDYANALSSINPKDIQTITVLKDAASTALYGARGANGVVLVTTKSGSSGKTKISVEARWGVTQVGPRGYDLMTDPADVYELAWQSIYNSARYGNDNGVTENHTNRVARPNMSHDEAALFASQHLFDYAGSLTSFQRNDLGNWMLYSVPGAQYTPTGTAGSPTASSTMTGAYLVNPDGRLNPQARLLYGGGEYRDELLRNAFRQEYNLSASGGSDKMQYVLSGGYLNNPSFIEGSSFERYTLRSNVSAQLTPWLKTGLRAAFTHRDTKVQATRWGRNPGNAQQNVFRYINSQMPLIPLYARDAEGNIVRDASGKPKVHTGNGDSYSPLGPTSAGLYPGNDIMTIMAMDADRTKGNDINIDAWATIDLPLGFSLTNNLSIKKYFEDRTRYMNSVNGQTKGEGALGRVKLDYQYLTLQTLLNWAGDWGEHHVDALLGHEYNAFDSDDLSFRTAYELIPGFQSAYNNVARYYGGTFSDPRNVRERTRMEGYLSRANYNYGGRYYLSASLRYDGSSKFKYSRNRWGTFWSVGGGWRISGEKFMESTRSWLDHLKVRASYGVIGNQNGVSNYSGYQTWSYSAKFQSSTSGNGKPASLALSKGAYVNDNLTWENVHTFDCGVDFTLFDRLSGSVDYYNKETVNAIWAKPIAYSKGQTSISDNTAKIRNRGVEVDLSLDIIKKKDLYWSVSTNGTHFTTVLTGVPQGVGSDALGGCWTSDASEKFAQTGAYGQNGEICYLRGVGKPYYNMYLYHYGGVAGNPGKEYWLDGQKYTGKEGDPARGMALYGVRVSEQNAALYPGAQVGESVLTTDFAEATRFEQGDALPKWMGGVSTYLKYKDFDLNVAMAYQLGGKFFGYEYGNGFYVSEEWTSTGLSAELCGNTWTEQNPSARFPMVMYKDTGANGSTPMSKMYTDMALFSASYLSLKNVTIGYNLPRKWLDALHINKLRVYATGNNLLMATSHSGIDPRMSLTGGMDVAQGVYPYSRTFSFGLDIDL